MDGKTLTFGISGYLYRSAVLYYDHETETFPRLAKAGRLAALRSRSFWRSVDSFKDLNEAEEHVSAR